MRFVFTFVREKVKFVREKSVKCQGISRGPVCGNHAMGLGQYNSLGEYCGPHTASSVFLILICRQALHSRLN